MISRRPVFNHAAYCSTGAVIDHGIKRTASRPFWGFYKRRIPNDGRVRAQPSFLRRYLCLVSQRDDRRHAATAYYVSLTIGLSKIIYNNNMYTSARRIFSLSGRARVPQAYLNNVENIIARPTNPDVSKSLAG